MRYVLGHMNQNPHNRDCVIELYRQKGCTNGIRKGGVCIKHSIIVEKKLCRHEGCTNKNAQGGVC